VRIVLQRVARASVDVDGDCVGAIENGLLLLVGIAPDDGSVDMARAANKIANLRIFQDDQGKMNLSVLDIQGAVLAVSQFTLYADIQKGRRPSFVNAALPEVAEPLFDAFVAALRNEGLAVETGRFGAKMDVELLNAGPVTIIYEVAPQSTSG